MSTVQRKVFEQLKSFMVRITFNKKYIFAGLVKKPHAGGNSRKPQGQARSSGEEQGGEKGEALPGWPPMLGKKGKDFFSLKYHNFSPSGRSRRLYRPDMQEGLDTHGLVITVLVPLPFRCATPSLRSLLQLPALHSATATMGEC